MAARRACPVVAVCGRPNVGKSTLFNRITGRQRAIVHSEEGITRDRFYAQAQWGDRRFQVVDTGGVVEHPADAITVKMQEQVRCALEHADVILFVVDGQQEITRIDEEFRDTLFRLGKPVVLAVNKLDNPRLEAYAAEFYSLGLGEPFALSATHNRGVEALLDAVVAHLPAHRAAEEAAEESSATKIAVVGKPNVGKSSFVNALLNEERAIVDDQPGTTRDALDIDLHRNGVDYLLIDTAGMRKKAGIRRQVEHFSVSRSLRAVRRADVCLAMVEAPEGITEQDKRILNYIREIGTALVLVYTKWDLVAEKEKRLKQLEEERAFKAPFLQYVPSVTISNVTRQRLFTVFDYVDRVAAQAQQRVPTAELNKFVEELKLQRGPAAHKGGRAKILYATQAGVKPTTLVLFVNQKRLFHFSYVRFIENRFRERYGFEGVPLHIELREGKPK